MNNRDEVIRLIKDAFKRNKYPGDDNIRESNQGDEPFLLEKEFKGKKDWQYLNSSFLDQAPDGFSTALCFFSDKAFCFYLPAYLIADLKGELECTDVVRHLHFGLDAASRNKKVSPLYGNQTWSDLNIAKYSIFSKPEIEAIVAYLEYKKVSDDELDKSDIREIDQALDFYWKKRLLEFPVGKHRKNKKKGVRGR